jgi:hypothetical protein
MGMETEEVLEMSREITEIRMGLRKYTTRFVLCLEPPLGSGGCL